MGLRAGAGTGTGSAGVAGTKSVDTSAALAGFAAAESVDTSLAGFGRRPHRRGGRVSCPGPLPEGRALSPPTPPASSIRPRAPPPPARAGTPTPLSGVHTPWP